MLLFQKATGGSAPTKQEANENNRRHETGTQTQDKGYWIFQDLERNSSSLQNHRKAFLCIRYRAQPAQIVGQKTLGEIFFNMTIMEYLLCSEPFEKRFLQSDENLRLKC